MNLSTVAQNLRNTIAGKEKYLAASKESRNSEDPHVRTMTYTMVQMLEENIAELKRILTDVEQCVEKDVEQSWRDNPDRMGGQFTDEEIRSRGEWR